jgi:hypothetical protein
VRQQAGVKEVRLLRGADDPNDVMLLFEASDLAKAQAFATSDDLRDVMTRAGVIGTPELTYLKD